MAFPPTTWRPLLRSCWAPSRVGMTRLMAFIGATIGGYAGWAAGEPFGIFAAFVVSIVLTAAGGYYGRKMGKHYGG